MTCAQNHMVRRTQKLFTSLYDTWIPDCTVTHSAASLHVLFTIQLKILLTCRSPTWSFENQKDVRKRPAGPVQNPKKDAASDPQGFFGISRSFGFTKRNEVNTPLLCMYSLKVV